MEIKAIITSKYKDKRGIPHLFYNERQKNYEPEVLPAYYTSIIFETIQVGDSIHKLPSENKCIVYHRIKQYRKIVL